MTWDEWQAVVDQVATKLATKSFLFANPPKGDPELLYPDLSPDRFGNYLTKAWQIVRAMEIYEPWYKADKLHCKAFNQTVLLPEKLAKKHLELLNARAAKQYHLALNTRQRNNDGN